ncbi:hypothetical protein [Rhodococcus erythropolis]|nr:hypothetical protein [Rhodococcus erythropolis]MDJ0015501.1 hypothetical protein [Rhodococcus erythropolis]
MEHPLVVHDVLPVAELVSWIVEDPTELLQGRLSGTVTAESV